MKQTTIKTDDNLFSSLRVNGIHNIKYSALQKQIVKIELLRNKHIHNLHELEQNVKTESCDKLVRSMQQWIQDIITARGGHTEY